MNEIGPQLIYSKWTEVQPYSHQDWRDSCHRLPPMKQQRSSFDPLHRERSLRVWKDKEILVSYFVPTY